MFSSGIVLGLSGFVNFANLLNTTNKGRQQIAAAASLGSWAPGPNTLSLAVHCAMLRTGKILYVSGSAAHASNALGPFKAGLLDPVTGSQAAMIIPEDLFCSGMSQLPFGNILIAGGTLKYGQDIYAGQFFGLNSAYEFDPASESFVKVSSMLHGRWYPTLVTLPDGRIFIASGYDELGCENKLSEIFDPKLKTWQPQFDLQTDIKYCVGQCNSNIPTSPCYGGTNSGANPVLSLYPRMHLMPNGLVAMVGPLPNLMTYQHWTGHWFVASAKMSTSRFYGATTLLPFSNVPNPQVEILAAGGWSNSLQVATNSCEIITPVRNILSSRSSTPMNYARNYLNSVILPNGKIFINGGTSIANNTANAVYAAELFDPVTETWTVLPSATVPRMYHSASLLMQDGRVWTASTSVVGQKDELRTEIFSPSYLFDTRPTISGNPIVGSYNDLITIPTQDPGSVTSVSLVRLTCVTHSLNTEQRLLWLPIVGRTGTSVTVLSPINSSYAPPGYYFIHILNENGIPSKAAIILIPGPSAFNVPPTVSITSPIDGSTVKVTSSKTNLNIIGISSDAGGSGIKNIAVKTSDNSSSSYVTVNHPSDDWSNWSCVVTLTGTGTKVVTAKATDAVGSSSTASITINLST